MNVVEEIKNDLSKSKRSYRFVVYRAFFDLVDEKGKAWFEEIVNYYKQFYLARRKQEGIQVESSDAEEVIREINEETSINAIKKHIKSPPLEHINYLNQENKIIKMEKSIWNSLTRNNIQSLKDYFAEKMKGYFNKQVGGYKMSIPEVGKEEIIQACKEFDESYRGQDRWANFTAKKNHKYALKYNDNLYPVKKIISLATGKHVSTFSGGKEANNYIENLDFEIKNLKDYIQRNEKELVFKKEVNWSLFNWGLTIPVDLHDKFYQLSEEHLDIGVSRETTFIINDLEYTVSLKNVDRGTQSETLQIRYDNNDQLKDLLKEKFSFSYQYITEERARQKENGKQRPQVRLPEDKKEYFKIYSTEEPYKFAVELETINGPLRTNFNYILDTYYQARTSEEFAGHELGDLFRHELPDILADQIEDFSLPNDYAIKGSIGQGNWARVPWLAIMDQDITTTTREEVYVVYLFAEDMSSLYLTFNQGVTNTSREEQISRRKKLREELDLKDLTADNELELADRGLGSDYEDSTIGYLEYKKDDLPAEKELLNDLKQVLKIYNQYKQRYKQEEIAEAVVQKERPPEGVLTDIKDYIFSSGFNYPDGLIENFYLSLKTKPFVLLAGISGTGKTKLAKLFAEAIGCTTENKRFQIIPVRPDWSDPSDLLGYKDLDGNFRPGPLIDIIQEANQNPTYPHLVCLDEMNLARVEYYFSDILSTIETREKTLEGIQSEILLTEDYFNKEDDKEKYAGLRLPDNLYIIGTVNMDETTHPFSKKVLDRANTIEFSQVELGQYTLSSQPEEPLTEVSNQFLAPEYLTLSNCKEEDREIIDQVVEKLQEINQILKLDNLHVGYRVRDEISFYLIYNQRYDLFDFDRAFDYQLRQKILPRIQGSSSLIKEILVRLFNLCSGADLTADSRRVAGEALSYAEGGAEPYPQSAEKLAYMIKRFEEDGFTAYWL